MKHGSEDIHDMRSIDQAKIINDGSAAINAIKANLHPSAARNIWIKGS